MRTKIEEIITSHIDPKWFTTEPKPSDKGDNIPPLAQNNAKRFVIALVRETIAPMINRSEEPEETISVMLPDRRQVIEIPARKMKSKEKLLGLRYSRAFGTVPPGYEYNAVRSPEMLKNPNSVIFGDSVVGDNEQAMFPSRVKYSSSYSLRERTEITQKLTHNALSEAGTMWDREEEKHRTSLFSTEYIKPGTLFPSFIDLDDPTPEALMHILLCLRETTYGAQTSITGPNIRNHIVAIMACAIEPPISSYTIVESSADLIPDVTLLSLSTRIVEALKNYPGDLLAGDKLEKMLVQLRGLDERTQEEAYNRLKEDAEAVWAYSGFGGKKKSSKAK